MKYRLFVLTLCLTLFAGHPLWAEELAGSVSEQTLSHNGDMGNGGDGAGKANPQEIEAPAWLEDYVPPRTQTLQFRARLEGTSLYWGGQRVSADDPRFDGNGAAEQDENAFEVYTTSRTRNQREFTQTCHLFQAFDGERTKDLSRLRFCGAWTDGERMITPAPGQPPMGRVQNQNLEDELQVFFAFDEDLLLRAEFPSGEELDVILRLDGLPWLGSYYEDEQLYLVLEEGPRIVGLETVNTGRWRGSLEYSRLAINEERPLIEISSVLGIELRTMVELPQNSPSRADFEAYLRSQREPISREGAQPLLGWHIGLGAGYHVVDYRQAVVDNSNLNYLDFNGPGSYFELGYRGARYGALLSYKGTPGAFDNSNAEIDQENYLWTTLSMEGLWFGQNSRSFLGMDVYSGLRAGVQAHSIPFLRVNPDASLTFRENRMNTASFGFFVSGLF